MNKINLAEVPIVERKSPKGKFRLLRQNISRALSGVNGLEKAGLKQPFDVELVRLLPRAVNWPYHSHSAQWEFYFIVSGRGQVRTPDGNFDVRDGDCFIHPPGEPHQMTNTGAMDLVYYVIADNVLSDVAHYPDSKKWKIAGQENPVRVQPANYYDGEE
jgi:uncharacterized cupin superfamily protein